MKFFSLSILLIVLSSCSVDVDYHVPITRFESPETNGKFLSGNASASFGLSQKVQLAEVSEDIIFNFAGPSVDNDSQWDNSAAFGAQLGLGILDRMDLVFRGNHDSPDTFGLKFQIFGSSRLEKKNGFKMSYVATYGTSENSDGTLVINSNNYSTNLAIDVIDQELIFGHRYNEELIFYLNTFYSYYDVEAKLSSTSVTDQNIKGKTRSFGALFGIEYNAPTSGAASIFLKGETGFARSEWESTSHLSTSPVLGAAMGIHW